MSEHLKRAREAWVEVTYCHSEAADERSRHIHHGDGEIAESDAWLDKCEGEIAIAVKALRAHLGDTPRDRNWVRLELLRAQVEQLDELIGWEEQER